MKTIHKYRVNCFEGVNICSMPIGAEILHVDYQKFDAYIWALVEKGEDIFEDRLIEVIYTGKEIDEKVRIYIGTLTIAALVCHFFEQPIPSASQFG